MLIFRYYLVVNYKITKENYKILLSITYLKEFSNVYCKIGMLRHNLSNKYLSSKNVDFFVNYDANIIVFISKQINHMLFRELSYLFNLVNFLRTKKLKNIQKTKNLS